MCVAKIHQVSGLLAQMISIFGTLGSSFRGGGLRACEGRARLQGVSAVPGGGGEALEAVGRPGVPRGGSRLLPERGRGYCRPSPRG